MPAREPSNDTNRGSATAGVPSPGPGMCRSGGPGGESAGIVIDENLEIIEFLGQTGRFLHLPVGEPSLNVRSMAPRALEEAIIRAIRSGNGGRRGVCGGEVRIENDGAVQAVQIEVAPMPGRSAGRLEFQVTFEAVSARDQGTSSTAAASRHTPPSKPSRARPKPAGLSRALRESRSERAEVRSAYLDLEAAHCELNAAHQELTSLNREIERSNRSLTLAIEERDRAENLRREMESRLLQKQKLESLGVMAGGVAHDFNNILTSIVGHADLLVEQLPEDSPQWGFADEIEKAGLRATNLVKQMMAYSGRGRFVLERCDLVATVQDVADLIQISVPAGVRLEFRFDEPVPAVNADASQVQQVVINLAVNAAQSILAGEGLVCVGVRPGTQEDLACAQEDLEAPESARRYVILSVSDSGCGMSEATKARMFDPFFTTKAEGHGLGLAAVLGIVRGHGGCIRVDTAIGSGTTVQVFLQAAEQGPPAVQTEPRVQLAPLEGIVLVVDDQAEVRAAASAILRSAGLTVVTANSGVEAIAAIHHSASKIAAVVLDVTLPDTNGLEILRQIRKLWGPLPVVMSSGYDRQGAVSGRNRFRHVSFLQKPYKRAELMAKLREAMNAGAGRESEQPDGPA